MIRYDIDIGFDLIDEGGARDAIAAHHRGLPHCGDGFIPHHQLDATHRAVLVNGRAVGIAAYGDGALTLLTLARDAKKYDRQVMERVLAETHADHAFAASWDGHHIDLFGSFAVEISCQAYQFELLDPTPLRDPVVGITLRVATDDDLPYLESSGFQNDYVRLIRQQQLRIAELNREAVGIGVSVPHPLDESRVDIGMYVNEDRRCSGIGRSILALLARDVLAVGRQPVAGCWWRNWASRRTLEAAGLTCVGTIFRFTLDPSHFSS